MAYRRKLTNNEWLNWLRENKTELIACGLPPEAFQTELDWFLFLDHGYIQSKELHASQWWNIAWLDAVCARRLRELVVREYKDEYTDFVTSLDLVIEGRLTDDDTPTSANSPKIL